MNVLVVTHNLPLPTWGAGTRNYHLMKALARKHTVTVFALVDDRTEAEASLSLLEQIASDIRLVQLPYTRRKRLYQLAALATGRSHLLTAHSPTEAQAAFDDAVGQTGCGLVLFESVLVAGFRLPEGVKAVIDQHNVEHEVLWRTVENTPPSARRLYSWMEYRHLKAGEIALCRGADGIVATSEREALAYRELGVTTPVQVVPNGVDIAAFDSLDRPQIPGSIVFTGTMGYFPNVQAVLFFAEKCWPTIRNQVPHATWTIVGSNPPAEVSRLRQIPGIVVTGKVPEVQKYLAEAQVAIAPLLIGGGTRLKILEALSMRKAVVSTSLGCEGISVEPGEHLLVADDPEQIARDVVTLLREPELRRQLGEAGRALVEREYSWERCGDAMLRFVERVRTGAGESVRV